MEGVASSAGGEWVVRCRLSGRPPRNDVVGRSVIEYKMSELGIEK